MPHTTLALSIGAIADAAGVNVETIRFYQRKGLLATPRRQHGAIRRYRPHDASRVKFVKAAQRLGFSLDEIQALLNLEDGTHCDEARALAEQKLADVRSKLVQLRQMEAALEGLVAGCCATKGQVMCPLIATLQADAGSAVGKGSARGTRLTGEAKALVVALLSQD
jgi:MerR family mercuric resistance operon transcriptional regulator